MPYFSFWTTFVGQYRDKITRNRNRNPTEFVTIRSAKCSNLLQNLNFDRFLFYQFWATILLFLQVTNTNGRFIFIMKNILGGKARSGSVKAPYQFGNQPTNHDRASLPSRFPLTKTGWPRTERFGPGFRTRPDQNDQNLEISDRTRTNNILKISDRFGGLWIPISNGLSPRIHDDRCCWWQYSSQFTVSWSNKNSTSFGPFVFIIWSQIMILSDGWLYIFIYRKCEKINTNIIYCMCILYLPEKLTRLVSQTIFPHNFLWCLLCAEE